MVTERQQNILNLIIDIFTKTHEPVGSKTLQMHLMQIIFYLIQIKNGKHSKLYFAIHCLTSKLENMNDFIYQIILSTFETISKKYKKSESRKRSIKYSLC